MGNQLKTTEPPYVFIPLAADKKPFPFPEVLRHTSWQAEKLHTGRITLRVTVKAPVHIGSGLYELSEEAGFDEGFVVRGIMHAAGEPVIPGSSWKGAVRATYEACTKSCLRLITTSTQESYSKKWNQSKLPVEIVNDLTAKTRKDNGRVEVRLNQKAIGSLAACGEVKEPNDFKKLCPACALFGGLGYRGRVQFLEGRIVEQVKKKSELFRVDSANSPHLHKAGFSLKVRQGRDRPYVEVTDLKGRKFYRFDGQSQRPKEPIDYIPIGTVLEVSIEFERLLIEEIGGLLLCMGVNGGPRLRIGGGKPFGLGQLSTEVKKVEIYPAGRFEDYESQPEPLSDLDLWVDQATQSFKKIGFFHKAGFDTLVALSGGKRDGS